MLKRILLVLLAILGLSLLVVPWIESVIQRERQKPAVTAPHPARVTDPRPAREWWMTREAVELMARSISYDDLFRYNEKYVGEIVKFSGKVVQVVESGLRVSMGLYGWDDVVFVRYQGARLREGDHIFVYGKVRGLVTYRTVLGTLVTIPDIDVLYLDLTRKAGG